MQKHPFRCVKLRHFLCVTGVPLNKAGLSFAWGGIFESKPSYLARRRGGGMTARRA